MHISQDSERAISSAGVLPPKPLKRSGSAVFTTTDHGVPKYQGLHPGQGQGKKQQFKKERNSAPKSRIY